MVTLKDIADITGVSTTTISNVIHGHSNRVSEETIKKVNNAIRELGYVPNMSARSLASKNSCVVAFINHVITKNKGNMLEDPFHSTAVGAIERILTDNGYYLMLRTVRTTEELLSFLHNWNVDGLFLTGIFYDDFFDALSSCKIPVVLLDSYVRHPEICNVGLEDFQGTYLSTMHLIHKGHRRIGFATPRIRDGGVLQERFLGYKSALADAGISFDESIIFEYEMDTEESCREASDAIAAHPSLTGLVASADKLAVGIMSGLRHHGIRVPEDLSIVGFDDLPICSLVTPPLTSVHQDMQKKAEVAANFMLELLNGNTPSVTNIILPVSLTERESVRDLNT